MAKHKTGAEEPKEIFENLAAQQEFTKTIFNFLQFCEISEKHTKANIQHLSMGVFVI